MGTIISITRTTCSLTGEMACLAEIGLYSGVAATDWSWAPLWMDFDNDGLKDLVYFKWHS